MARKDDWERGYLYGPSIYVIMILLCLLFLDYRIAGAIFAILAFGDGFATLIGRKYGQHRIFNKKSWEGALAFFIFAMPTSLFIFLLINQLNTSTGGLTLSFTFLLPLTISLLPIEVIIGIFIVVNSVVTVLELIISDELNDNFLIPISAAIMFYLSFYTVIAFYPV